ncbi:PREDICTED: cytochrome P450 315a1, mitochondrial [Rhagoletis zephyria]|uniref:cytochrome P450 315a1, mitochondrial n=1 Tax=Rhagoletis zephyria TaxID=28612 RepID=UPI000811829C|nr:PREDICTED: cytochrome P450 315a1, mitochondrial [Rhagoletis zephyria]
MLNSLSTVLLSALRTFWLRLTLIFDKSHKYQLNGEQCPALQSKAFTSHAAAAPTTTAAKSATPPPLPPCMTTEAWPQKAKDEKAALRKLPRPKGLPLIGTFWDLVAAGGGQQLHKYIHRRHKELGSIFYERLGGVQDAVFVSSASQMRAVFQYEGQYPRHPLPESWIIYNKQYNCQRGLFFMEGAEWLHNRRILNRFLLGGTMKWMDAHIESSTMRLVNLWKTQASAVAAQCAYIELLELEHQLYTWAIDVVCTIMFGVSAAEDVRMAATMDQFSRIVHRIFDTSSALMTFPPQLAKRLNMRIWRDFEESVEAVLKQGNILIEQFVDLPAPMVNRLCEKVGTECHDCGGDALFQKLILAGMPLDMIKRIFVDLVIAAGDTTAYTTEWAFYLLTQNQEMQERLAKEMATNDGRGNMLVHGLIKETMRLYPIAPFIGRYMACEANIGGYQIEKNSLVLLSLYTAGRKPEHFPDPEVAKPERWQRNEETGELQEVLQAHGSLPFAIGNRSCIGRRMAMKQMHCLLAAVISNFQLQCNNATPIDCKLRLVTVPAQPLRLAIKLRDIA